MKWMFLPYSRGLGLFCFSLSSFVHNSIATLNEDEQIFRIGESQNKTYHPPSDPTAFNGVEDAHARGITPEFQPVQRKPKGTIYQPLRSQLFLFTK
jgi:hypothetical protein